MTNKMLKFSFDVILFVAALALVILCFGVINASLNVSVPESGYTDYYEEYTPPTDVEIIP